MSNNENEVKDENSKKAPVEGNMAASGLSCETCGNSSFRVFRGLCTGCNKVHLISKCALCGSAVNLASADVGQEDMPFANITPEVIEGMKKFIADSIENNAPISDALSSQVTDDAFFSPRGNGGKGGH